MISSSGRETETATAGPSGPSSIRVVCTRTGVPSSVTLLWRVLSSTPRATPTSLFLTFTGVEYGATQRVPSGATIWVYAKPVELLDAGRFSAQASYACSTRVSEARLLRRVVFSSS